MTQEKLLEVTKNLMSYLMVEVEKEGLTWENKIDVMGEIRNTIRAIDSIKVAS